MPAPIITPAQVAAIRQQKADGLLRTAEWAKALGCSRETIARVARGDSYNKAGQADSAGEPIGPGPDRDELEASLARFRRVAAEVAPQPPQVDAILEMLKRKQKGP